MLCPICKQPTNHLHHDPTIQGITLTLAQRITPNWTPQDGACQHCTHSIIQCGTELQQLKRGNRHTDFPNQNHYQHTLTQDEHHQWFHPHPDYASWRQRYIAGLTKHAAHQAGHKTWIILDTDKTILAQTPTTKKHEEQF